MAQGWGKGSVRRRVMLAAGGVALLLVVIAATMPKVFPFARGDHDAPAVLPDVPGFANFLLVTVSILVVVLAIVLRVSVVALVNPLQVRRRKPVLLQVLLIVGSMWLIAFAVAQLSGRDELPPPSVVEGSPGPVEAGAEPEPETSRTLGLMVTVGLGLLILGLAAAVLYFTRGERGEPSTAEKLAAELRAGIDEIRAARAPRDAVIACYARMEAVLTAAGVSVRPADTPFEFVERALTELDVPPASARRLTELFERARFSSHGTDEAMRTEAIAALEEVRAALEVESWENV